MIPPAPSFWIVQQAQLFLWQAGRNLRFGTPLSGLVCSHRHRHLHFCGDEGGVRTNLVSSLLSVSSLEGEGPWLAGSSTRGSPIAGGVRIGMSDVVATQQFFDYLLSLSPGSRSPSLSLLNHSSGFDTSWGSYLHIPHTSRTLPGALYLQISALLPLLFGIQASSPRHLHGARDRMIW